MTDTASFTRIPSLGDTVKVRHMDGTVTTFGSEVAYAIFKAGMANTNYTLFDATTDRWIIGTLEQMTLPEA